MFHSILQWIEGVDPEIETSYDRLEARMRWAQKYARVATVNDMYDEPLYSYIRSSISYTEGGIDLPKLSANSYPLTNCRNCGANSYENKCAYCGTIK